MRFMFIRLQIASLLKRLPDRPRPEKTASEIWYGQPPVTIRLPGRTFGGPMSQLHRQTRSVSHITASQTCLTGPHPCAGGP